MTNKNKGIFFIILSALGFALMSLFVKLSGDLPSMQKSFFRNLVSLIFAFFIIKKSNIGFKCKRENILPLVLRASFGTLGIIFNYYSIQNLILSDATMLNKLAPFFVIIFSFFILKEKIKLWQVLSILIAFLGSLFIINPNIIIGILNNNLPKTTLNSLPALVGVLGAMCAGIAYTMIRFLSLRGEKGPFIVFFFSCFSCLTILPFVLLNFYPMSIKQLIYLLLAGIFASLGQFAVTAAYANAPAKEISIFDYSQIIFSGILGYLVFNQKPDIYSFIGYFIICSVAIFMFFMNNKNK
ncbi:DMT family transporter [uncultured Tyzzerella sp.]|uniref:DMT family transporter n=1 Tax=uncultured Tyzzerella sp. TaxID=2321398 RepID=UPI002943BCB0|nr:DMT family transporter [uncultured Tyzzerella sp.]